MWRGMSPGATAVRTSSSAMPAAIIASFAPADIVFFSAGGSARTAGAAAGAALTCTGGGGHMTSPARATVTPRWTTSSRSSAHRPSLPGVTSLARLTRLVPYSCEAWAGRRPARSV